MKLLNAIKTLWLGLNKCVCVLHQGELIITRENKSLKQRLNTHSCLFHESESNTAQQSQRGLKD